MKCFLKDVDAKQESDSRIKNLVVNIKDVAYDKDCCGRT